jgi:hypothetical protein
VRSAREARGRHQTAGHAHAGGVSLLMGFRDRLVAVSLAVALAGGGAAPAGAQSSGAPPASLPTASSPPSAPPPADPAPVDAAELVRLKRKLATPTPLFDAAVHAPVPTFRISVSEKVDIWKYWGDPEAVSAYVRPSGGTWHHEFQNMVTPDEFKGYGGVLGNGEKLQLAATSLAFAGAMQLLGAGVRQAKEALANRAKRRAKEEVDRELAAFCAANPGACPAAPATPP